MSKAPTGSTFSNLQLKIDELDRKNPKRAAEALRSALAKYKDDRLLWYQSQMRDRSKVVNGLPIVSAVLGAIGVFLTAIAAVVRALSIIGFAFSDKADVVLLAIAVTAYALMSAGLLYERLTEGTGGYFRAASTIVAIRDLWTQYQFGDIARSLAPPNSDEEKELARWIVPAQDFCKALDAVVSAEMTEWKAAYLAAAKLRSDATDEGLKLALVELKKSADSAAASANEASKKADEAARAASNARDPAVLNIELKTKSILGEAVVSVDGIEAKRGTNQTEFSIVGLKQGTHVVHIVFTPTDNAKTAVVFEKSINLGAGINNVPIDLIG